MEADQRQRAPQRTCLGCGERAAQAELIRLAVIDGSRLVVDGRVGRGGYLHRREACWRQFVQRKSHFRAFRLELSRSAKEQLVEEFKDRDWE